jgi:hypothetical protein
MLMRATAIAAATLLTTSLFAQRQTVPNTVKYKDSGIPNATGRSGSASVEARALLGRDGVTHLELTTGSFDDGGASGEIAKVQVKTGTATKNYDNLENGGTATLATNGLLRHQSIQMQTNVRGVDHRNDVVTLDTVVKLRPDLAVTAVSAPPQVLPNATVTIYATVQELNGDTGARANARLLVGGAETDRADNIWVDSNGNVSVAFTHTFTAYGSAELQVIVDSVDPGDWDDANNSAVASVEVAERLDNWSVHAVERTSSNEQSSHSPLWDTHTVMSQTHQQTDFYGWIQHPVALTGFSMSTSASSDGMVLYDYPSVPFFEPFRTSPNGARCTSAETSDPRIDVCSQPMSNSQAPNGFMLFEIHFGVGDVVYHSWGYSYADDPYDPYDQPRGVYDQSSVRKETKGPLGNTVQWDFRFTDGDGVVYHEQPFLSSLTTRQSQLNFPWRCFYSDDWGFEVCSDYYDQSVTREGYATGAN